MCIGYIVNTITGFVYRSIGNELQRGRREGGKGASRMLIVSCHCYSLTTLVLVPTSAIPVLITTTTLFVTIIGAIEGRE